jgi:imidazolonepropionase-like amidohydrolase
MRAATALACREPRPGFTKCLTAGVRIAFGTDSGIYPHGLNARQFAYQVRCGQSPLGAIQSATIHAAELIRWDDRVGRIAPGYLADIIAVTGNPLQDIRLLENAVFVMKDGAIQQDLTLMSARQGAVRHDRSLRLGRLG